MKPFLVELCFLFLFFQINLISCYVPCMLFFINVSLELDSNCCQISNSQKE